MANKDKQIHLRVNEYEYTVIQNLAKRRNCSITKLIIDLVTAEFYRNMHK